MPTRHRRRRIASNYRWDVPRGQQVWVWQRLTPPQLFVGSFVLLILLGTLGLKWLPGLHSSEHEPLNWTDALFTATSAVCVTGLIVVDTATYFTFAGQAFLLLLIQIGGLGMLAFTSLIIVALGRRLSLRQEALSTSALEAAPHIHPRRLMFDVVRFTLLFEGIGALLLYALWIPRYGWAAALWPAIFHSISAFCNAGFSTFSDSLVGFHQDPFSLTVVMLLIISGGIGFLTIEELYLRYRAWQTGQNFRVSLHSRLVLGTTGILLLLGWVLFAVFESEATLAGMTIPQKLVNSLFMSVTARTAGFNTVDYGSASDSGNFLTILLMTIGGSPGSTAGGIKTTCFALLALLAWSRLKGHTITSVWSRSIREETSDRAIGLFIIASAIVVAGVFLLNASEHFNSGPGRFLHWMFEAVSAFNTVGLSMGVTGEMSKFGRWVTILLMFLGRVGPLTIAAVIAIRRASDGDFRYAYEDVVVG